MVVNEDALLNIILNFAQSALPFTLPLAMGFGLGLGLGLRISSVPKMMSQNLLVTPNP